MCPLQILGDSLASFCVCCRCNLQITHNWEDTVPLHSHYYTRVVLDIASSSKDSLGVVLGCKTNNRSVIEGLKHDHPGMSLHHPHILEANIDHG